MASAFVTISDLQPDAAGAVLTLAILFSGTDVPGGLDWTTATVALSGGESPVQIRSALAGAARAEASRLGYAVAANTVLLPSFEKG